MEGFVSRLEQLKNDEKQLDSASKPALSKAEWVRNDKL